MINNTLLTRSTILTGRPLSTAGRGGEELLELLEGLPRALADV